MKKLLPVLLIGSLSAMAGTLYAQTTTYILVRHAEKDTSVQGSMKANPPLSKEGLLRAEKLVATLKAYKPDLIYSTDFIRTRSTVTPLAAAFHKDIQTYDPRNLAAFAEQLLQVQGKTIVVAGHSNTTPALANLLLKENRYANLDDNVYNQYWIITITGGKAEAMVMTY